MEGAQKKVLFIEKDREKLHDFVEYVSKNGVSVVYAEDIKEVPDMMVGGNPDLIIVGSDMMSVGGVRLTSYIKTNSAFKDIPVIVITPESDAGAEINAFRDGAADSVHWGIRPEVLLYRINHVLEEDKKLRSISGELDKKNQSVEEKTSQLENISLQLVKTLSMVVEAKDVYTQGHSQRVADYSKEILRRMGGGVKQQNDIYMIALLHDIGKIGIRDDIINKPTALTGEEYTIVKQHTVTGYKILKNITELPEISAGAKWHHERYDGKGYPDGLRENEIPRVARIIAVADAYDAMTSNRSYRQAMPQYMVRQEIVKGMGTQFDPEPAKCMLSMIDDDQNYQLREKPRDKYRVLIVDDDPMNLKMAEFVLKSTEKYEVFKASSGMECLNFLCENGADIVLLDIEMPVMNGFQTLETIRQNKDLRGLPVIFLTADTSQESIRKAITLGLNGYVAKPFVPKYLLERVEAALS